MLKELIRINCNYSKFLYRTHVKDYGYFFGTTFLPGKIRREIYKDDILQMIDVFSFSYEVDDKGRVIELNMVQEVIDANGQEIPIVNYRYKYTYKN